MAKGSSLPLPISLGDALAEEATALAEGSSLLPAGTGGVLVKELLAAGSLVLLVSLIGNGLCLHGSLHRLQRTRGAFLLVLHAGTCNLTLQSPRGLASKPGKEASAAEPQEDDSGGCHLPCLSDFSAMSRLLVKEALATCSLPLTFEGRVLVKKMLSCASGLLAGGLLLLACTNSMLVQEPLVMGSLFLVGASGLLNKECFVLARPQIVDGCLPIHVDAVHTSVSPMKNGLSGCPRRQQSGSLLVFANGSLMPAFFIAKRSTNVGRGVLAFVLVKQPLRGAWGRLRPFKLQPP